MSKYALLCGCNYPGSDAELAGCVNDVMMVKDFLMEYKGFEEDNISIMIDTDDSYPDPSGEAMKSALNDLVLRAEEGDVVVFHFSGHGTQVPSDRDDPEPDRRDEAICPTDMNLIVDDDLKAIVSQLAEGADMTVITDCCHSGSMLDHEEVQIDGPKAGEEGQYMPVLDILASMLGGGDREIDPAEIGVASRELPTDNVAAIVSGKLGTEIPPEFLRRGLGMLYGGSASGKMKIPGDGSMAALAAQMGAAQGVEGEDLDNLVAGAEERGFASIMESLGTNVEGVPPPEALGPADRDPLGDDTGILITGCQSSETSADVRIPGEEPYGALTHTLMEVAKQNPEATYIETVTNVRARLAELGYAQNPCLECSDGNAEKPFICAM